MMRRNLSLGVVLSMVLSGFTVALFASPAQADWSGAGYLQNVGTRDCAVETPSHRSLGDTVVLHDCGKVNKWQWRYRTVGYANGYRLVQIKNKRSGYCLGVGNTNNRGRIRNTYCVHPTGGRPKPTKWKVWASNTSHGFLKFKNRWSHMCMGIHKTSSGTYLMAQHYCDGTKASQEWSGSWYAVAGS